MHSGQAGTRYAEWRRCWYVRAATQCGFAAAAVLLCKVFGSLFSTCIWAATPQLCSMSNTELLFYAVPAQCAH